VRIDIVTIFPGYLEPLRLSLPGRAIDHGLLRLEVHDLRDFAVDRHRTVDDSPYGGGPGMVMTAPVWGAAIDHLLDVGPVGVEPLLVIPTPSGRVFRQSTAVEYVARPWLIFACGRYEGIDARVAEHYRDRIAVDQVSLGDFVLAGGEVATLAMCESVLRLLPGVLGNEDSATDDSFSTDLAGLLEGPSYTRPAEWRGIRVPPVLLSGDHGAVAEWRRRESIRRTQGFRPDLLPDGVLPDGA